MTANFYAASASRNSTFSKVPKSILEKQSVKLLIYEVLPCERLAPDASGVEVGSYIPSRADRSSRRDTRRRASRLLEGSAPPHFVQAVLGHADLSATSTYLSITDAGMQQIMQQFEQRRRSA